MKKFWIGPPKVSTIVPFARTTLRADPSSTFWPTWPRLTVCLVESTLLGSNLWPLSPSRWSVESARKLLFMTGWGFSSIYTSNTMVSNWLSTTSHMSWPKKAQIKTIPIASLPNSRWETEKVASPKRCCKWRLKSGPMVASTSVKSAPLFHQLTTFMTSKPMFTSYTTLLQMTTQICSEGKLT